MGHDVVEPGLLPKGGIGSHRTHVQLKSLPCNMKNEARATGGILCATACGGTVTHVQLRSLPCDIKDEVRDIGGQGHRWHTVCDGLR